MLRSLMPFMPVLAIATAIGLYFFHIQPAWDAIQILKEEEMQFDEALIRARELGALKERLDSQYALFTEEDFTNLDKLLPERVDGIRLILDVAGIATNQGLALENIKVATPRENNQKSKDVEVQKANISFTVLTTYEKLLSFLSDLENSLRIIDVKTFTFTIEDRVGGILPRDVIRFNVELTTYAYQ